MNPNTLKLVADSLLTHESNSQKESFFESILETSHDEIWVCDAMGRTLYCNSAFEKNYGIPRHEMLGKTVQFLIDNGYSDQSPIPEVIETKKQVTMMQQTVTGRKLIITATPLLDNLGQLMFIVENCRDITELESVREEYYRQKDILERYQSEIDLLRAERNKGQLEMHSTCPSMERVLHTINRIAPTSVSVLLNGESGTGKSEFAKYIHRMSPRKDQAFMTINCTTIPEALFESELFGYESGSFTGARTKGKKGLIELADQGTLFLDEIGDVPLKVQVKLLQFLQDKTFTPVGGSVPKQVDVRIIAATNRDLDELMAQKLFREDLYYRLSVVQIVLPPLRERKEDIPQLAGQFLSKYNQEYRYHKTFEPAVLSLFEKYWWPGNIRELQNLINQLVVMSQKNQISLDDLPNGLRFDLASAKSDEPVDLDYMLATFEADLIKRYYAQSVSSYKLAEKLGISQSKANRLIRKYVDLGKDRFKGVE